MSTNSTEQNGILFPWAFQGWSTDPKNISLYSDPSKKRKARPGDMFRNIATIHGGVFFKNSRIVTQASIILLITISIALLVGILALLIS